MPSLHSDAFQQKFFLFSITLITLSLAGIGCRMTQAPSSDSQPASVSQSNTTTGKPMLAATSTTAKSSTQKGCGTDVACFIAAARTCAPASLTFTFVKPHTDGTNETVTEFFELRGKQAGLCKYYEKVLRSKYAFSEPRETMLAKAQAQNLTDQEMSDLKGTLDFIEQGWTSKEKDAVGLEAICSISNLDIFVAAEEKFFKGDLLASNAWIPDAHCTGSISDIGKNDPFGFGTNYSNYLRTAPSPSVQTHKDDLSTPQQRDKKRVSDLLQIQTMLELVHEDLRHYPISPAPLTLGAGKAACVGPNGFGSLGCAQPYLAVIPTDPTSGAHYMYTSDGSTYQITATLEAGSEMGGMSLKAGAIKATPEGISN